MNYFTDTHVIGRQTGVAGMQPTKVWAQSPPTWRARRECGGRRAFVAAGKTGAAPRARGNERRTRNSEAAVAQDRSTTNIVALVTRAQAGDAGAYADLYRIHQRYVATIVADGISDTEARNDLSQAVFEQAWVKLDMLREPSSFRAWLAQITRRMIVDHHRRSARTITTDFSAGIDGNDIADDDWSPHEWAAMRELADAVNIAVTGMSVRDVAVIDLATTFGFNANEIAAALDVKPGHARVLLHRARQRLSDELGTSVREDNA